MENNNRLFPLRREVLLLIPFFVFFSVLVLVNSQNIFFWDTVQLSSRHAHFFYENNFSEILLPDSIDSGHLPGFGFFLAIIWKIFGKNLIVSHLVMLIFIYGIIYQAYLLIKKFISEPFVFYALLLFLADSTLLAQSILVSPDIPLVFFFLTALNASFIDKKILLSFAILGLFLTGMRGTMVAFAVFLIDFYLQTELKFNLIVSKKYLKRILVYVPALLIFLTYSFYHYQTKHWIGYHKASPWAVNFEITDFNGFLKNVMILGWRMLDFGRIFLWIPTIILILIFRKSVFDDKKLRLLLIVFLVLLISLSTSFLIYRSLTAHRYLLPLYLIFSIIASYFIFEILKAKKIKFFLTLIVLVGMLSGNIWIYPVGISQGWDATLAHVPYYGLRNKMIAYIKEKNIPFEEIGSAFPNVTELKYLEMSQDTAKFQEKNLNVQKYILFSNIFNDFSDEEINRLQTDFDLIKEFKSKGIFLKLYKKRDKN